MTQEPPVVPLEAVPIRYRFVSAHAVVGLSALPESRDLALDLGEAHVTARLTLDPNIALAAVDRGAALAYLIFRAAFQGQNSGPNILAAVETEVAERARQRRERFPNGVFLLLEALGQVTSSPTDVARDLKGAVLAFDAIDKAAIQTAHQPLVIAALAALALSVDASASIIQISEGVELTLPDGRPLYSLSIRGGPAKVIAARPATVATAEAFQRAVRALIHDEHLASPTRLWVDALRSTDDRLEAFIVAWAALEMLIRRYTVDCENGEWISRVPEGVRAAATALHEGFVASEHQFYSLANRTRVFAFLLGITDGVELAAELIRVKNAYREPLYHQGVIQEAALPVDTLLALARRLFSGVLK
jgi:hypothetical protein